jgi:hypothetical protein
MGVTQLVSIDDGSRLALTRPLAPQKLRSRPLTQASQSKCQVMPMIGSLLTISVPRHSTTFVVTLVPPFGWKWCFLLVIMSL